MRLQLLSLVGLMRSVQEQTKREVILFVIILTNKSNRFLLQNLFVLYRWTKKSKVQFLLF